MLPEKREAQGEMPQKDIYKRQVSAALSARSASGSSHAKGSVCRLQYPLVS